MAKRGIFSPEMKKEAACLVLDQNYTIEEASIAIGASKTAIRSWSKQLELERQGVTPSGSKALTADHHYSGSPSINGRLRFNWQGLKDMLRYFQIEPLRVSKRFVETDWY